MVRFATTTLGPYSERRVNFNSGLQIEGNPDFEGYPYSERRLTNPGYL